MLYFKLSTNIYIKTIVIFLMYIFFISELETVFRSRRAAQGVMRGYAGISRRGSPLVFVGGYAAHTRHVPRYAAPSNIEEQEVNPEEEPVEPMEDEEEPEEDEEEQEEEEKVTTAAPVKYVNHTYDLII
jgi:hypothetical protein